MDDRPISVLQELANRLAVDGQSTFRRHVEGAIEEIARLRATQFRWIPMTERTPTPADSDRQGMVFFMGAGGGADCAGYSYAGHYSHWSPIPPLPEQSQEDRDEQEWNHYALMGKASDSRLAFLAGLKAARKQKPL